MVESETEQEAHEPWKTSSRKRAEMTAALRRRRTSAWGARLGLAHSARAAANGSENVNGSGLAERSGSCWGLRGGGRGSRGNEVEDVGIGFLETPG